jgi:hypothetical protein
MADPGFAANIRDRMPLSTLLQNERAAARQ